MCVQYSRLASITTLFPSSLTVWWLSENFYIRQSADFQVHFQVYLYSVIQVYFPSQILTLFPSCPKVASGGSLKTSLWDNLQICKCILSSVFSKCIFLFQHFTRGSILMGQSNSQWDNLQISKCILSSVFSKCIFLFQHLRHGSILTLFPSCLNVASGASLKTS